MREEKDKNDQKSGLPSVISRQSRKIPQNTKKEDKLRSSKLVKCGVPVNREKEFNVQKVIRQRKILYMKVKNVLTKKEKRQETLTRKSMIGQLSTTGREESAQNITSVYQVWKEKREKSAKTKIRHPWRGNQSW